MEPFANLNSAIRGLRVLADDLSGAADCAASFTGACGPLPVFLHPPAQVDDACFAVDLDTRSRDEEAAAGRFASVIASPACAVGSRTLFYKKIDSTLRGHLAAELRPLLERFPTVVVAPAFPAQGRTLVAGRPHVQGHPLDGWPDALHTVLAHRLGRAADVRLVPATAIPALKLDGRAAPGAPARVFVVDARDERDLDWIAQIVRAAAVPPLVAGSSGLARALAGRPTVLKAPRGAMLVVSGSFAPAARAQAAAFIDRPRCVDIRCAPGETLDATQRTRALGALRRGEDVIVQFAGRDAPARPARDAARALAPGLVDIIPHCATLALSGGDTARAVLEALGIARLRIAGEALPGIAMSEPLGESGPRVVLKAGGFGDNDAWTRIRP